MKNKIFVKDSVEKDLKKNPKDKVQKTLKKIKNTLSKEPEKGKRLKGSYSEFLSLRIGDYRIIYTFIRDGVLVLKVAHRKDVYRQ